MDRLEVMKAYLEGKEIIDSDGDRCRVRAGVEQTYSEHTKKWCPCEATFTGYIGVRIAEPPSETKEAFAARILVDLAKDFSMKGFVAVPEALQAKAAELSK